MSSLSCVSACHVAVEEGKNTYFFKYCPRKGRHVKEGKGNTKKGKVKEPKEGKTSVDKIVYVVRSYFFRLRWSGLRYHVGIKRRRRLKKKKYLHPLSEFIENACLSLFYFNEDMRYFFLFQNQNVRYRL